MEIKNGREEKIALSLSRWTDVPASKWPWFRQSLQAGELIAFDQRDGLPYRWSLVPAEVHGLIFWTKNPRNLISDADHLRAFPLHVHMTLTGWEEVERGAPSLEEGCSLLQEAVGVFGRERVTWRLSPLPVLPEATLLRRFDRVVETATKVGLDRVVVAFVQTNDLIREPRSLEEKRRLLALLAEHARGLQVELCADDMTVLDLWPPTGRARPQNLRSGICAPPSTFFDGAPMERCGCALMADPFTINESCVMGCSYCYAADQSLSVRKRNTTRSLRVIR